MDFELEGNYPIIIDGKETGTIDVSRDGLFWSFEATSEMESGVIRLSVFGDEGEGYLGVMEPKENRLRLKKKLSRSALSGFPQQITHAGKRGERHMTVQPAKEEPPTVEVHFEELPQSETVPADNAPVEKAPEDTFAPPPKADEKPEENKAAENLKEDKVAFTPLSESDCPDCVEEKPPKQENPQPPMIVHRPNPGVSKPVQQRSAQQRKAAAPKQEKATASMTSAQKLLELQKQEAKPEDAAQESQIAIPKQEPKAAAPQPETKAAPKPEKAAAPKQEKKPVASPAQKQTQQQPAPKQEKKPAAQLVQKPEEDASKALVWWPCGCPASYLSTMIGKNLFGAQKNVMEATDGEYLYLAIPEEPAQLTDSQRRLFSSDAVILGEKYLVCKIKNGIIE